MDSRGLGTFVWPYKGFRKRGEVEGGRESKPGLSKASRKLEEGGSWGSGGGRRDRG